MSKRASTDVCGPQEAAVSVEPASDPREEEAMTVSLAPPPGSGKHSPQLFAWIFGASLLVHVPAALALARSHHAAHVKREQEVEINLAPPPPPPEPEPPPPPPPPEPEPPKPAPVPVQAPLVHLQAAPTSTAPSAPVGDVPNMVATPGELAMPAPPPAPVAPPAPPAPPPPPPPIVEAKEGAHYRSNARPAYPRLALREGWEGTVYLRVEVLPDGHVAHATVQRSAGHPALDDAALAVVRNWLFDPATQGGRGVFSIVTVPLQFKLE
jgi:periplasmic protein TonB